MKSQVVEEFLDLIRKLWEKYNGFHDIRYDYSAMYGPTTGDKIRLADTDLIIEVERDFTTYGEEVKFGGGKVIRMGWGNHKHTL